MCCVGITKDAGVADIHPCIAMEFFVHIEPALHSNIQTVLIIMMVVRSGFPNRKECVCNFASRNVVTQYVSQYVSVL